MSGKQTKKQVFLGIILLFAATILPLFQAQSVFADQITDRSLTLQRGAGGDGGSTPDGVVNHKFDFTVPTTGTNIGSIKFEYCTTATGTCTTPTGVDMTSPTPTMGTQGGDATGFTIGNGGDAPAPSGGTVYITRVTPSTPTPNGTIDLTLNGVGNPTAANETFFVRITTYSASDGVTGAVDTGVVAASTANQINFTGIMPEALVFCTGATVNATCTTVTNPTIDFGVFSPTSTVSATSEMAASTNAESGYVITVSGDTLANGSNTIPAMTTPATSTIGQSEFGLNLMANTTPSVGTTYAPVFDGGDYTGQPTGSYATADTFAFDDTTPTTVASSTGPSAAQEYTVAYIVNVAGNQTAGTYTTTLTYICTPTY